MSEMVDKQNVIDLVLSAIEDDWDVDYTIARINEMPVVNKEDIVSKQQVIDTIMGEPSETYYPCYFAEMIRKLPATYPKVIRCGDCKHWKNEHLCESLSRFGSFETKADFYCGYAERKINERTG